MALRIAGIDNSLESNTTCSITRHNDKANAVVKYMEMASFSCVRTARSMRFYKTHRLQGVEETHLRRPSVRIRTSYGRASWNKDLLDHESFTKW
jgi:hypothetical protein